ncbi:MAG: hypothetical protein JHC33_13015 [Ignisphaera sp.]|jgi:hypothetical protein|nr:hypothetical protein [Ignisphaera sp.]
MEKLVALVFLSRDYAHIFHLLSKSYEEHMILNDFYDEVIDDIDEIAETYQGKYGQFKEINRMTNDAKATALDTLKVHVKWIEDNRYKLCKQEDNSIQSLIDVLIDRYYRTLYKLENLK